MEPKELSPLPYLIGSIRNIFSMMEEVDYREGPLTSTRRPRRPRKITPNAPNGKRAKAKAARKANLKGRKP